MCYQVSGYQTLHHAQASTIGMHGAGYSPLDPMTWIVNIIIQHPLDVNSLSCGVE